MEDKKKPKRKPPWSRRKRIGVTVAGTLAILLIAYVIGGSLYVIGLRAGWLEDESDLKLAVMKEVLQDPGLVTAIQETATTQECINARYGFRVRYRPPLQVMTTEGENACLQWQLPGSGSKDARVIITRTGTASDEVLAGLLEGMEDVWAESVFYPDFSGTKLQGVRDEQLFFGYVLEGSRGATWIVELLPAHDVHVTVIEELVSTMDII